MKTMKHLRSVKFYAVVLVTAFTMFFAYNSFFNEAYSAFPTKQKSEKVESKPTQTTTTSTSTEVNTKEVVEAASPNDTDKTNGGKSQLIALLLCIFLGGLGIHRFYLGYTWQGIVQLLTGGGCGVWALIDLIRIIMGTLKPKNGDYEDTL